MRVIYPENNHTNIYPDATPVTKEDLAILASQISDLSTEVASNEEKFEQYRTQQSLVTATETLRAVRAELDGAITAIEANLADIDTETISVSDMADIKRVIAETAQITDQLTAASATITTADIASLSAITAAIGDLTVHSLKVTEWVTDLLTVHSLRATSVTATTVTSDTTETDRLTAATATVSRLTATKESVGELEAALSSVDTVSTSRIVWKDWTVMSDPDDYYIEIPHFENGSYHIHASSDGDTVFSIEVLNSVDNYLVRVSQAAMGYLTAIYQYGEGKDAQLFIKADTKGKTVQFRYSCLSASNVGAPMTHNVLPVVPSVSYIIDKQNFSKFFKLVDLANQGSTTGVLIGLTTDKRSLATEQYNYDTTGNVTVRTYLPDQSLNSTDDVKFNSVESPFLNVSELEVTHLAKFPNIYNGGELGQTEQNELPNKSIYIPNKVTSGTTIPGVRLLKGSAVVTDVSATLTDMIKGRTFESYSPYPNSDGYDVITDNPTITASIPVAALLIDSNGQYHWLGSFSGGNGVQYDLQFSTVLSYTAHSATSAIWTDSSLKVPVTSLTEGLNVFITEATEAFSATVVYSNITVQSVGPLQWTRVSADKSAEQIYIKDSNGVSPVVPYNETAADNDEYPLKYNPDTERIEKNLSDVTVGNDLEVKGDLIVDGSMSTPTVTVQQTLNVLGDAFMNGNAIFDKTVTVKKDLIVEGEQFVTTASTLDTTADYLVLRQNSPNGLGNKEYSGIVVQNYDGNGSNLAFGTGNHGILRVSQNTHETTIDYTLFSKVEDGATVTFYNGLTQDTIKTVDTSGVIINRDEVEFSSCVYHNGKYYHWDNVAWFLLTLDSSNILGYDVTDPITDADLIAVLDGLVKVKLTWYRRLTVMTVDAAENQPIATRDEAENLPDGTLVRWDLSEKQLKAIQNQPTINGQALVAEIGKAVTVSGLYTLDSNGASEYYELPPNWTTPMAAPTGTLSGGFSIGSARQYDNKWYYHNSSGWLLITDIAEGAGGGYYEFVISDTAETDTAILAALDAADDYYWHSGMWTDTSRVGKVSYKWGSAGGGGNLVFATRADYQTALAIAEGEEGYIGDGYQVTILSEQDYITTEAQE